MMPEWPVEAMLEEVLEAYEEFRTSDRQRCRDLFPPVNELQLQTVVRDFRAEFGIRPR